METCKKNKYTIKQSTRANNKWFNKEIENAIKLKEFLYKRQKIYPNNQNIKKQYKKQKNLVTYLISKSKFNHNCKQIQENISNKKKTEKIIKEIVFNTKDSTQNKPKLKYIIHNNIKITNTEAIANEFGNYFANIGENLVEK
jgi:hypothetical protein